jgi:UPF0755 protein
MHLPLKWLAMIVVLCTAAAIGWFIWFAKTPLVLANAPLDVSIDSGSTMTSVSRQLADAGVPFAPWQFTLLARLKGQTAAVKAGSYELESGVTPLQLLRRLTRGDVTQADMALIEGWTFKQLRAAIDQHAGLKHDTQAMSEREILAAIGADEPSAEGLFFPETYLFSKRSSDLDLLKRAYRAMKTHLAEQWARRDPDLPYADSYQALIAASLVEKETGVAADRALVAAVFVNRLKGGMLLQTDPTVIYGMGSAFDGNLRKEDLMRDTAYNTYLRAGLPPTPIAMPGLASIQAAVRPAKTDHLYFVARGDGSSEFSRTLEDHNRAVMRYQKRKSN